MTIVANTYTRYGASALREQLSDVIYNISPEDTPFVSSCSRESAKQTLFEWQTDSLATVSTGNAQLEGDDITSFDAVTATARVGNYTQISRKLLILSGTLEAVDKAGRKSEMAYQMAKRGAELRRDMEAICLENIGGVAGGTTTARKTATMGAWIKTNDDVGSSGESPVYTSGVPGAARTDGTDRDYDETILKTVAQSVWTSGGTLKTLMVGPYNKGVVSGFTGVVTRNFDMSNVSPKPTAAIASIDVYVTDFGTLKVIPNRFQQEGDAWYLDFEYLALAHLRAFRTIKLAKTGDAEKRMLLVEWGLKVKQEAALGLAADLSTS